MKAPWWQTGVVYQVYPRSFADSNGDGVGDLRGLQRRLDHLEWLGIDAVWLSPIFTSPMADFGYDVADYTNVDPLFGTLADLDALIDDMHRRGMRMLLDYVPNHTSDQHPWFVDACSSRSAEHRDWYIWRDASPDGGPPNNWQSVFRGSAWEWHAPTGQYYFHSFLKEQPDLDWTNPQVREAMIEVLRFWLERGIDGFRVDVISLLGKGPELEPGDTYADGALFGDQAPVHDIIADLRTVLDSYGERLMIGELYLPPERTMTYYGAANNGIHMPFNFQLLDIEWTPENIHGAVGQYERLLPADAWPNWVLSNHDQPRVATRIGPAQARVAAMLLLTLRGTPTIYYGDEIGMLDVDVPAEAQRDPQGLRGGYSRDPARSPMRWDAGPGAGFTKGTSWLPMGSALDTINVATESAQPDSRLSLYRALLRLRRSELALTIGSWRDLGRAGSTLAYLREHDERRLLICLNLGSQAAQLAPATAELAGRIVAATRMARVGERFDGARGLAADEGFVVLLDASN